MPQIEIQRHIKAPIEKVFYRTSDFPNAAQTVEGITKVEMLTEGPVALGTRFRETRTMFGREATEEMEVISFDPPTGYALHAESHGSRYLSTFTFEEKNGGTDVKLIFVATPLTLFAKIMTILMKPMTKKVMMLCAKDLDDIAKHLEKEQGLEKE